MTTAVEAAERSIVEPSRKSIEWTEIPPEKVPEWNERLLRTSASLFQYPYWNEPYRRYCLTKPRYLAWSNDTGCHAYVCVLTIGPPHLRIGLVFRGPVNLSGVQPIPTKILNDLREWACSQGYVFLRFSHSDHELLNRVASLGFSQLIDAFPFYDDSAVNYGELVVDQLPDDQQMLATFDREARRKIRRATEAGYEVRFEDTPESLARLWPLFRKCSQRKGFHLNRSLSTYLDMVGLARPHGCARVYSVYRDGVPVEASVVLRDRDTAVCLLAALDAQLLEGKVSPSVLLHWRSMRDLHRLGVQHYNFGLGPGTVVRFKQQFSPRVNTYPAAVTLVINQPLYHLWSRSAQPLGQSVVSWVRSSRSR